MPAMIDVDLRVPSDAGASRASRAAVRAAAPAARVDRHDALDVAGQRASCARDAGSPRRSSLLMAAATAAVVLLAARAGLETHRDTIEVLHMLGSTDVQVARLFQRRIALDTLIGGAIGAVAAMAAMLVRRAPDARARLGTARRR